MPSIRVERNTCSRKDLATIARDPDVVLSHAGRSVIFEVKASAKKRDLSYACTLREQYSAATTKYFLVGGYASFVPSDFNTLLVDRWACFTQASARNRISLSRLPQLDDLLVEATAFLNAA